MNIEISTQEYRDLLDMLHLADVVMSGHRREEDKRTERHRALIQKLYALGPGEGFGAMIGYSPSAQAYMPTGEFEKSSIAHALLDEFGDHLFWDELINRLSMRDAARTAGGTERLTGMGSHDREQVVGPIRQHYIEEFSANGVANLELVEQFGAPEGLPFKTSD